MGDKQQPPKLPKGAPDNLTKFVSCESPKLTWTAGKIDWLKIKDLLPKDFPGKDWLPDDAKPEISFEDDGKGGVNIGIGVGGLTIITLPATIKGGKLSVDTSGVPNVGQAREGIAKWVDQLNGSLKDNGKQLGGFTLKNKTLTLEKSPLAAVVPPSDGGAQHAGAPTGPGPGTKAVAAGFVLAGLVSGIALVHAGDSTTTVSKQVVTTRTVTPPAPSVAPPPPVSSAPPTEAPKLELVDGTLGTFHVGPGHSFVQICVSVPPAFDGTYRAVFAQTPVGAALRGIGSVRNGLGVISVPITSFGSYAGLTVSGPGSAPLPGLGPIGKQLPWVVDATPKPCDPKTLEKAPAPAPASESVAPVTPPPPPVESVAPSRVLSTATTAEDVTTDRPPWSLLFIPGGLLLAAGTLFAGRRRDGDEVELDDDGYVKTDVDPPVLPPWTLPPQLAANDEPLDQLPADFPHTVEKPGTRDATAVQGDVYQGGPTDPDVWFSDTMWRLLNHSMENRKFVQGLGPRATIRVIYVDDPWLVPDNIDGLEKGDKIALAFRQLLDSGQLGSDFEDALLGLLSPEAVFFFACMFALQFVPGANVAVDVTAFLILLYYLGEQIDLFLDGLQHSMTAINQAQLDRGKRELSQAIANVGVAAIAALVGKIAGKGAQKLKQKWNAGKAPAGEPVKPGGGRNPELSKGGTHDALPEKTDFTKGGTHDALPPEKAPTDLGGKWHEDPTFSIDDPTDPPRDPNTREVLPERETVDADPEPPDHESVGEYAKKNPIPSKELTAQGIEIRNLDIDNLKGPLTPEQVDYYNDVRNADIRYLNSAPPSFWDAITDPQTRRYLEELKNQPLR